MRSAECWRERVAYEFGTGDRFLPPVLVLWAYSDGAGRRKLLLIEKRVG